MKLKKLILGIPLEIYRGSKEVEITGLTIHSKRVFPGNLFIAKKGSEEDGAKYIQEAISNGASAILGDAPDPFLRDVVQLVHPDISSIEGLLAERYYDAPSKNLFMVGVTGTSGKTTVTYLVKHLLEAFHNPCGLIGTIEYITGQHYPAERTTPDVITNHKLLREMLSHHKEAAVMEVSSHALEQGRVDRVDFDVAIFTNLTQDHLDYHNTMESYGDAKAKLLQSLSSDKVAVVNKDDPATQKMLRNCQAQILTYGLNPNADLYAHHINLQPNGTDFEVTYRGETVKFHWRLIGLFNVMNCLAALGTCLSFGLTLSQLPIAVESFLAVPGRLEWVENRLGLNVFVDYAHKEDALKKVLECLMGIKTGRIITVFGCGGNRDRLKRSKMAEAAEGYSDFTIVTSDNPRNEDPQEICNEVVQGFRGNNYLVEIDRREAIKRALAMAKKEDLILIAGKGHETYQIFSHQTIAFDDRIVVKELAEIMVCS